MRDDCQNRRVGNWYWLSQLEKTEGTTEEEERQERQRDDGRI